MREIFTMSNSPVWLSLEDMLDLEIAPFVF